MKKDPSIMLNDEDTPWLRQDHNQGSYVKKKIHCCACMIQRCMFNILSFRDGYYVICYEFTILIWEKLEVLQLMASDIHQYRCD